MKKLVIRNFGPISNAEVELKKFNFFIGNQGVGKSTLAKILCSVTNFSLYLLDNNDTLKQFRSILDEYNVTLYLKEDSFIEYEEDDFFVNDEGNNCCYTMRFQYVGNKCKTEIVCNGEDANHEILTQILIRRNFNKLFVAEISNMLNKNKGQLKDLQLFFVNMNKETLYIPAERIMFSVLPKLLPALTLAQASVPRNLLHFFVECNNAKESFKSYDIPLLGITFLHKGEDDYVVVDDSYTIPLDASSSGMQSAIPLLLTMDYAINKGHYRSYVIEEPECNLYPANQIELIDRIIGIINQQKPDFRPSLTITTHSPYIINYLNVLIRRYAKRVNKTGVDVEELAVYYVTNEGGVTDLMSIDNCTDEKIVNTIDLSETMGDIYSEFKSLG